MVVAKLKQSDLSDLDTKQRIMEVAVHLFAVKGFDGTSIRDIATRADVNVASVNYHFKTKENLRIAVMEYIVEDFEKRVSQIQRCKNVAEHAVKLYEAMTVDKAKCLNQFKLILESENHPCKESPYPMGYEQFAVYLDSELKASVPLAERFWFSNIVFGYIIHISVISSSGIGKVAIDVHLPNKRASIPDYISQLVESLIRDLNTRY